MKIRQIRKALVPLIVSGILSVLAIFGITEGMTVGEVVTTLVTAGAVWMVPNDSA